MMNFRGHLLHSFVQSGHEVLVCSPGGHDDVERQLNTIGIMHHCIDMDRTGINPVRELFTLADLVRTFYREKPDLILNYTVKPVIYASIAGCLSGIKKIYSVIPGLGYVFSGKQTHNKVIRFFVVNLYRFALRRNNAVFFLNRDNIDLFSQLNLVNQDNTIQLNGEGVDISFYRPDGSQLKQTTFLLIARLLWDKGIGEFVDAAVILKKRYPNTIFQVLGPLDSNPSAIPKAQVLAWQAAGIIDYLGETRDVRPYIANSSVFVLPSYGEGLPRTILEAMAMGRPIITTDAPGCRETVTDGDNGFLVPVKNVSTLVSAMEKLILQPDLIKKMGKRSREIAEEKYDVYKVNAVIMKAMGVREF
jgi:glycosyltransferase involved in cell wall biosynthesis